MTTSKTHPSNFYTTKEFAARAGVQGTTVRRMHSLEGHYLGVRPLKLPNSRLLWPVSEVETLLSEVRRAGHE